MNNIIKADVKVTYEQYRKFAIYNTFKAGRGLKPAVVILYSATILFLLYSISLLVTDGFDALLFGLTVFIVLLQAAQIVRMFYNIRKNYTAKKENDAVAHYVFGPDCVKIETLSKTVTGQSELKYEAFTSIVESRGSFYLYISKASALIVPMNAITEGTAGMLSALLREKIGSKHIFSY